jgi:hypothetical protein
MLFSLSMSSKYEIHQQWGKGTRKGSHLHRVPIKVTDPFCLPLKAIFSSAPIHYIVIYQYHSWIWIQHEFSDRLGTIMPYLDILRILDFSPIMAQIERITRIFLQRDFQKTHAFSIWTKRSTCLFREWSSWPLDSYFCRSTDRSVINFSYLCLLGTKTLTLKMRHRTSNSRLNLF